MATNNRFFPLSFFDKKFLAWTFKVFKNYLPVSLSSHLSFKVENVKTLTLPLQGRLPGSLITCCFFEPHLMNVFSFQCTILKQTQYKAEQKHFLCLAGAVDFIRISLNLFFAQLLLFSAIMWWVICSMTVIPTYNANINLLPNSSMYTFGFLFLYCTHVVTGAVSPTFNPPCFLSQSPICLFNFKCQSLCLFVAPPIMVLF